MAGRNINDFGSATVTEWRWGFIQTWIWKVEEVSYQVLRCECRLYFSGASTPSPAQLFKYTSLWKAEQVGSRTGRKNQVTPHLTTSCTVVKLATSKALLHVAAALKKKKKKRKTTFAATSPHQLWLMNPWWTGVITHAWRILTLINKSIFNIHGERTVSGQGARVLGREKISTRWSAQIRLILHTPWLVLGLFQWLVTTPPDVCRTVVIVSIAVNIWVCHHVCFFCLAHGSWDVRCVCS